MHLVKESRFQNDDNRSRLFMVICRNIWINRNQMIFEGKKTYIEDTVNRIQSFKLEMDLSFQIEEERELHVLPAPDFPWRSPVPEELKLNVDVAVDQRASIAWGGAVLRGFHGHFVAATSFQVDFCKSSMENEAMVLRKALRRGLSVTTEPFSIESDSQLLVKEVRQMVSPNNEWGFLLDDIKSLLRCAQCRSIDFIKRSANKVAHRLARVYLLHRLAFVSDATELPQEQHYDYIVVGGGTAGCPLAATLSESYSVLLLERGGTPHENPDVLRQEKLFDVVLQPNHKDSPAQKFISEDGVSNIRARVLGGGTVINGGFYSRGNAEFYKGSGIEWDMDRVSESYQWVEERIVFEPDIENWEWQKSVKEGLLKAGTNSPYHGFNLDHVVGTKISGSIFDMDGKRHPAMELLSSGNPDNLKVAVHATVEKVIFSSSDSPAGPRATGVIYKDTTGVSHKAILRDSDGEVILSAGTIGSTQLLLLSGVGPEQQLSSFNISTVKHNPHVGKYLSDPPRNNINIIPPFPVEPSGISVVAITPDYYIEAISSTYGFNSPISHIFFPYPNPPVNLPVLSIFEKLAKTTSVGSLHLVSSTDVEVDPKVQFNYFSTPEDLARCVSGIRNIEQVMNSNAMEKYKFQGKNGGKSFRFAGSSWNEHASLEAMCRDTKTTIWHYHGGCTVGKVVDQDLKVIGVSALRVVDGSTFTQSPGTNPQATLMMFGRYVGLKIQEKRRLLGRTENIVRSEL